LKPPSVDRRGLFCYNICRNTAQRQTICTHPRKRRFSGSSNAKTTLTGSHQVQEIVSCKAVTAKLWTRTRLPASNIALFLSGFLSLGSFL